MAIMIVFIIMPISDLSLMGVGICISYGLIYMVLIIPGNFMDTIFIFYYKMYLNEDRL